MRVLLSDDLITSIPAIENGEPLIDLFTPGSFGDRYWAYLEDRPHAICGPASNSGGWRGHGLLRGSADFFPG